MWPKESSEDADGMVASVLCTAATNNKIWTRMQTHHQFYEPQGWPPEPSEDIVDRISWRFQNLLKLDEQSPKIE
jgi:hypothetical protein